MRIRFNKKPLFSGSNKGIILETLAKSGEMTYKELKNSSIELQSLDDKQFKSHTQYLQKNYLIIYNKEKKKYWITNSNFLHDYTHYTDTKNKSIIEKIAGFFYLKTFFKNHINKLNSELLLKLDADKYEKQYFLNKHEIIEITQFLIKNAKYEIRIVNFIIDEIDITRELITSKNNNPEINIQIITNKDDDKYFKFHDLLRNNNIDVFIENTIHAKILIIDFSYIIISSMNFTPYSISGKSIEAGILSTSKTISNKAIKFFEELLPN